MNHKHHDIERQFKRIAPDVAVMWNPVIDRWQVLHETRSAIVGLDGKKFHGRKLMWTIEQENGSYREPGSVDVQRLIQTVEQSKQLWSGDVDKIADAADAELAAREKRVNGESAEMIREVAREMARLKYRKSFSVRMGQ